MITFSRVWSMPSADTFTIRPIAALLERWLKGTDMVVDPFARNNKWATHTNDLSTDTFAQHHLDAVAFLDLMLQKYEGLFDAALLDPPYSPRQVTEVYQSVGRKVGMKDTQTACLYKNCKERMARLLKPNGVAITCGWNSGGFGLKNGFTMREILLVPCGGAHNDYIVTVETKDQ